MSRPIPTRYPKPHIHAYAEDVASRLGFSRQEPIDPIVVQLGGTIEYRTADIASDRLPESIIVNGWNNFIIYLPSLTSAVRDRFTIAHELGHLFLHYALAVQRFPDEPMVATRWVDESDDDLVRTEWEANWFAAAFLMPENDFKQVHRECLKSIEATAYEFKVSVKAAQIRAQSLGIS